jgi:hypothetical protein
MPLLLSGFLATNMDFYRTTKHTQGDGYVIQWPYLESSVINGTTVFAPHLVAGVQATIRVYGLGLRVWGLGLGFRVLGLS